MDFDDLDQAIDERLAEEGTLEGAAGLLAASKQTLKAYEPADYMPPIPRPGTKLPDFEEHLSAKAKKGLPKQPARQVSIRAFMFYGEGDSFEACANLVASAPAYMEVAVHEWPSHGLRAAEAPCGSVDELAEDAFRAIKPAIKEHGEGGKLEGAPFVLIGSATGALVVAALAQKLRWEVGVEPSAVVILDRAPPQLPLFSEQGRRQLEREPEAFLSAAYPAVMQANRYLPPEQAAAEVKRWLADCRLACDTRKEGSHVFNCDVLVLRGLQNLALDQAASVEFQAATLAIEGVAETLTVPVRSSTKVLELKKAVASACRCDVGQIALASGAGPLADGDLAPAGVTTTVTGIKSFKAAPYNWPHPIAVVGAGYNGIKTAIEYLREGRENIAVFDRHGQVGGYAWIDAANEQSKTQTEFASFHIWFGPEFVVEKKCGGWPRGWDCWAKKADVLKHFNLIAEEYGLNSHCYFHSNVSKLDIVGGETNHDRYYNLHVDSLKGEKSIEVPVSVMYNYPGSLTRYRVVEYRGESQFGGLIGYGMCDAFDYAAVTQKRVAIIGNGAFAVENVRSCLEYAAEKVYLVTRRKNLASPRLPCWFVHQAPVATPGRMVLHMFEPMYALCGMGDPWGYWSVHASKDHWNVTIKQNSRFGIGDVTFLAVAYGKLEYVQDTVDHMSKGALHLTGGRKLEGISCVNKSLGLLGDWAVDKLHQQTKMVGMWCGGDWRRVLSIDATGMNAANFKTFSLGVVVHGGVKNHKFLHDFPEEYYRAEAAGLLQALPQSKADEALDKPAYVTDVKYSMHTGITISAFVPMMDLQCIYDNQYMHCLYHKVHPVDTFLEEAIEDWDKYQQMFKDQGCDHEYIVYPYTKDVIQGFVERYNREMGTSISLSGPTEAECQEVLDKAMANYRDFDLRMMSRKVNAAMYGDEKLAVDPSEALNKKLEQAAREKLTSSKPGSAMDFDLEQYDGWREWTSGHCEVVDVEADKWTIKDHPLALEKIFELCKRKQAPPPKA